MKYVANLSTEQIVGQSGLAYAVGMEVLVWESIACFSILTLAFVFLPNYLRHGVSTIPEFLALRYDNQFRFVILFLIQTSYAFILLPGIIAFVMFDGSLPLPDAAYPTLVKAILPPWMYGIFGAIIFGAILSTYVAALNSAATLFSLDFYKGIFRKDASERSVVRVGRITNVVIALVSIGLAPLLINAPTGLYNFLQEYVGFYNIPLIVIILFGFFNKSVSAVGAKICFTFHIVVYIIAKFLFGDLNFLYIHSVLFFLDILVMWGSTKFAPLAGGYSFTPNANKVDLTPWKYRKYVAVVVVLGIFTVYAIFSPLGIGR